MKKFFIGLFIMFVCTTIMSKNDNLPSTVFRYQNSVTQSGRLLPVYSRDFIGNFGIDQIMTGSIPVGEIKPLFGCAVDSSMIVTTIKYPIGYSQGIIIDTIVFIMTGGNESNSVTPKISYGPDISYTGTAIINSPTAITSVSAPTKISTFDNDTVPKTNMIWLSFSAVGSPPRNFMVEIIGHVL